MRNASFCVIGHSADVWLISIFVSGETMNTVKLQSVVTKTLLGTTLGIATGFLALAGTSSPSFASAAKPVKHAVTTTKTTSIKPKVAVKAKTTNAKHTTRKHAVKHTAAKHSTAKHVVKKTATKPTHAAKAMSTKHTTSKVKTKVTAPKK